MKINELDWLTEAEEQDLAGKEVGSDDQTPEPDNTDKDNVEDDVTEDPAEPDEDPEIAENKDFEQWKHDFCELSIKNDVEGMIDSISQVRMRPGLEPFQRKFVEDNLQVLLYRREVNVQQANKEIRNLIKKDLDKTNPGTTIMSHFVSVIQKDQMLQQCLIKMSGLYSQKGDVHRKYMAAVLGSVMIGSGQESPDLLFCEKDYTVKISTRYVTQFGEINLGKWSLKKDDPSRYLSEPELQRLQSGSPDEKQSLRRRIIAESIGEKFKERAFLIHVMNENGEIINIGLDLGDSLLNGYKSGKIVVRGQENSEKEAIISDTGEIISVIDYDIKLVREDNSTNDEGAPNLVETPFLERRDCILYLVADLEAIKVAASTMSGMLLTSLPYSGNPSEIIKLQQCVPSLVETLNRQC